MSQTLAETGRSGTTSSEAAWRRLAERALGAGVDTRQSRSADGLIIKPLYARSAADSKQPWRSQTGTWSVAQRIDHPDPEAANRQALLDLEGGADALVLVSDASPYGRGFGLDVSNSALGAVLDQVELDFIGLRLDAGTGTPEALSALTRLIDERRLTSAALNVDVGFDPLGWQARHSRPMNDDPHAILDMRAKAGLAGAAFLADGRPWHEAGAGEAQELAAVLATALAYLRRQEGLGLTLDAARSNIALLLAADADVFLGLAKFRAMRRLWARIETACGLAPRPVRLHAETSWRMMARRDPWTNVMRASAATVAAGLGGADVINVLPFTLPIGLPNAGARRLARNVQRVLLDEAHLAKVEDPAAGAGGFEALTDGLCETAWVLFQEIEREGGIARAIESGSLATRIAATASNRARHVADLTQGIIGTNRFASLDAPSIEVLDVPARPQTEGGPNALPAHRDAAPFEMLRDRADGMAERPGVFLATLGAPAAFGARAIYASNFFAAGGLAAAAPIEARPLTGLVADFAATACAVACICGTDRDYATQIAATAAALREAGARRVLSAGVPGESEGAWREAGIDAFIHDGCDVLQILADALDLSAHRPIRSPA